MSDSDTDAAILALIDPDSPESLDDLRAGLRLLCDLSEANGNLPEAAYHTVVIPDSGDHACRSFPTPAEAAAYLRGFAGKDVKVRAFYGRACKITRPPARYLLTHEGRFPLFDESGDDGEVDETGSLLAPRAIVVSSPPTPADAGSAPDDDNPHDDNDDNDDEDDDDDDDEDEDEAGS